MIQLALRERFQIDKEGSTFIFCGLLSIGGFAFDEVFGAVVWIGDGGHVGGVVAPVQKSVLVTYVDLAARKQSGTRGVVDEQKLIYLAIHSRTILPAISLCYLPPTYL